MHSPILESDGECKSSCDGSAATASSEVVENGTLGETKDDDPKEGRGASSNSKTKAEPQVGQSLDAKQNHKKEWI